MPSFLNKVFGYKRHDDKEATRLVREPLDSTLLDGKYEAILPIFSPSSSTFAEAQQTKDPDRDGGFALFKSKILGGSQKSAQKHSVNVPHLTLHLPGPKEKLDSRALGVVFEADPGSQIVLDDATIAKKRLNPLEALILIRACTQAITERGLETLGIMHPHWFTASPDVQRKLISLFIHSLTQSRLTTLSPTSTSSTSTFEKELHYTRSPHDVAAVLRWGLRHLSLENDCFGKGSAEWGWYNTFFQAERSASYPPKGFSELLPPQLPPPHIELLTATLSLISSLASHAEANSISGSKLSKFLGLWLLVATRAEQSDDWNRFYARWERSGRILEHLFLAHLREESFGQRLPTRLQELITYYPYNKGSPPTDDNLLPRPRFSTRQYDALFVRVETLLAHNAEQPKQHPIQLLLDAFQLPIDNSSSDEHTTLWNTLKTTAFEETVSSDSKGPQFTRIFVDETIHLLSLIPADNNIPISPALLTSPITKVVSRRRSSSLTKAAERIACKSNANDGSTPVSPSSPSSIVVTDWTQFALSGFGDTSTTQPLPALFSQDDDIEVTQPRVSRKSSGRGKSRTRQCSEDHGPLDTPPSSHPDPESFIIETKIASVHVVQVDEAFVDFWSDAIVDPISANWPSFVVCGLKQTPNVKQSIRWLVIEQAYSREEPSRAPSLDGRRGRSPRPSFRSDISGFRINSVFSSARKRFSVFSKSATDLDLKRSGGKTPVAGELGEILVEEEPIFLSTPPVKAGLHVDGNGAAKAAVTGGATVDVADQPKGVEMSTAPIVDVPPTPVPKVSTCHPGIESRNIDFRKEEAGSVQAVAKPSSIELPRPSVRASEETVTRDSPPTHDVVNPKIDSSVNQLASIAPLPADTSGSRSTQDTCDPTILASGPAYSAENRSAEEGQAQGRHVAVKNEVRPVELVAQRADRDEHLHAESPPNVAQVDVADNGSREDAKVVAMSLIPETVVVVAATPVAQPPALTTVDNQSAKLSVEEPHVATQPPQRASADPVAAITVESAGQHEIDHLFSVSATEVIATEGGAQLEPRSINSVVGELEEAKELAEHVEKLTPAPELLAFVKKTPGQDVSVDVSEHSGAAQVPAAKPNVLADAAPQVVAFNGVASQPQPVAAGLQATLIAEAIHPVEKSCDEVILAVDTDVQAVNVEIEHAADQAPEPVVEEAQPHVQDTLVQTAEAPLVEAKLEANVSAGNVSASQVPDEVEVQAAPDRFVHEDHIVGTQDAETLTSAPQHAALVDETRGSDITEDAPRTLPELEVEARTRDPVVESPEAQPSSGAELPTQVRDHQVAEALSTGVNPEAATAARKTYDVPSDDAESCRGQVSGTRYRRSAGLCEEAAPIASEPVAITPIPIVTIEEPVAHDVKAPTETDPSSEPAPQFVDEAANSPPSIDVVSVPEEIIVGEVEVHVEHQVLQPTVNTVDEPGAEDAEAAPPAPELDEPEQVVVSEPATVVEDELVPVKTESSPVLIGVCKAESQLEGRSRGLHDTCPADDVLIATPTVAISETGQVSELH
ncbi:hypothetical protein JVT61DRAFT_14536 [Boletus reticuloceps]|uniref:Meiotically up-regulated protein Msb1/Mug8 domain-containing protein n=1 Tax=Boletus reticuloceps TaxID=495285 RepID=A0A8I3ABW3_9AGAM|nr:hypothetical protein JVT61DRAFT_14536 [Boletus reticuloceps]